MKSTRAFLYHILPAFSWRYKGTEAYDEMIINYLINARLTICQSANLGYARETRRLMM